MRMRRIIVDYLCRECKCRRCVPTGARVVLDNPEMTSRVRYTGCLGLAKRRQITDLCSSISGNGFREQIHTLTPLLVDDR